MRTACGRESESAKIHEGRTRGGWDFALQYNLMKENILTHIEVWGKYIEHFVTILAKGVP